MTAVSEAGEALTAVADDAVETDEAADEATPVRRRFNGLDHNGLRRILPDAASVVPKDVREASDLALKAHDEAEAARAAYHSAVAELKRAPALDRSADREAVAAGRPLSEDRVEPRAKAAEAMAKRRLYASLSEFKSAQVELAHVILAARPTWLPRQRKAVKDKRVEIHALLSQLASAFDGLTTERMVLDGLTKMPTGGSLHAVHFGRISGRDEAAHERRRADAAVEVREHVALGGNFNSLVSRDLDHLIGALLMLVDDDK